MYGVIINRIGRVCQSRFAKNFSNIWVPSILRARPLKSTYSMKNKKKIISRKLLKEKISNMKKKLANLFVLIDTYVMEADDLEIAIRDMEEKL
jgi:hypothetical protein